MACYNKLGKCLVAGKDIKPGELCSVEIFEVMANYIEELFIILKNIGVHMDIFAKLNRLVKRKTLK